MKPRITGIEIPRSDRLAFVLSLAGISHVPSKIVSRGKMGFVWIGRDGEEGGS